MNVNNQFWYFKKPQMLYSPEDSRSGKGNFIEELYMYGYQPIREQWELIIQQYNKVKYLTDDT